MPAYRPGGGGRSARFEPVPPANHSPRLPNARLPPSRPPFLLTCSVKYGFVVASCNLVYFSSPSLFIFSFFFFENRFEPVIQLIISQGTGLVATAQHEAGDQETGPRKLLSRKSNFIIEKSSVLSSLLRHRHHKFTYSICRCRNHRAPFA